VCERCGKQGCYVEENREQGVILKRQLEAIKWCRCSKVVERKAVHPIKRKVQQSGIQPREPEDIAKERGSQREVRRTFQMLREIWLNIGVEKLDMHEGVTIKVLLDSGATEMFMDRKMVARHGFKL